MRKTISEDEKKNFCKLWGYNTTDENRTWKNITKEINFMRLIEKKIVNYLPYYKKFVLLHADYYQGAVKRFTLRVNSLPDGQG